MKSIKLGINNKKPVMRKLKRMFNRSVKVLDTKPLQRRIKHSIGGYKNKGCEYEDD